mgnify:CR=1 FL=1|tara:strand:- start:1301 stop:2590 length:1290 start_codon:yes stop_codon:yes gene_type:complete
MTIFRPFNEKLQKDWKDKNKDVPVNRALFVLSSENEEDTFVENIYPETSKKKKYFEYRNEWYRRAKEFDAGEYPLSVNCELVSTCNLACTMCYTITDKFQNSVVGAQRMLPWETLTKIIDEAADLGVPSISFSWRGESSMYRVRDKNNEIKDFADAFDYAYKKGILETTSLTHGQLIDEKLAERLVLANPSWISFSIDGLYETYNKIRTPAHKLDDKNFNAFEKVSESIKLLNKYKKKYNKKRPSIRTNTIFPAIQDNPDEYKNYMKKIGVDLITVNEMKDYRFHDLPDDRIQDKWACQYPFQRLTVSANGIIIPCTGAYNEEEGLVLGKYDGSKNKVIRDYEGKIVKQNLNEFNLHKAWHSEKLKKIRLLHKNGRRKEIDPGCKNCHHGTVHHGVDHLPKQWNAKEQKWQEHKILSNKRNYQRRGNIS